MACCPCREKNNDKNAPLVIPVKVTMGSIIKKQPLWRKKAGKHTSTKRFVFLVAQVLHLAGADCGWPLHLFVLATKNNIGSVNFGKSEFKTIYSESFCDATIYFF